MNKYRVDYYYYTDPKEVIHKQGSVHPPKVLTHPWVWLTKCRHTFKELPPNNLVYPAAEFLSDRINILLYPLSGYNLNYRGKLVIWRPNAK